MGSAEENLGIQMSSNWAKNFYLSKINWVETLNLIFQIKESKKNLMHSS